MSFVFLKCGCFLKCCVAGRQFRKKAGGYLFAYARSIIAGIYAKSLSVCARGKKLEVKRTGIFGARRFWAHSRASVGARGAGYGGSVWKFVLRAVNIAWRRAPLFRLSFTRAGVFQKRSGSFQSKLVPQNFLKIFFSASGQICNVSASAIFFKKSFGFAPGRRNSGRPAFAAPPPAILFGSFSLKIAPLRRARG